jgi:Tfp pilus assembly protein PilO
VLADVVQQTDSGVVEVLAIVLALVAVIAITGFFSWREEQEFLYDREQRKRLRRELSKKLRDDEIEEDYQ